jgi:hypothetical protein
MSLNTRHATEEGTVLNTLEQMRAEITRLEKAAPQLVELTLELRHRMILLTSQVQALRSTTAALRMVGETVQCEQMLISLHRAGDHSLDREEAA